MLPYQARVARREPFRGPVLTPGERNIRPLVELGPQRAPDPPRQGDCPARPARMGIVFFLSPFGVWAMDDFATARLYQDPSIGRPRGRMSPDELRQNIANPPSIAYGSMLGELGHSPYGL